MNFLGLNSPEIFLISVIILIILGSKRIEKGWLLFQRLLKFLLSKEVLVEAKSDESVTREVTEEVIEAKSTESVASEVTEEVIEAKSTESVASEVTEEVIEAKSDVLLESEVIEDAVESNSDESVESEFKDKVFKKDLKEKKPISKKTKKEKINKDN